MPNSHDYSKKYQRNVWLTHEFDELLQAKALSEGKTMATVIRELLHAHFPQCPYKIEDYYNPGGWPIGRSRKPRTNRKSK